MQIYFEIEADLDELEQKVHLMCVSYQYFEFWKDFLYKPHRPNKRGKKKKFYGLWQYKKTVKPKYTYTCIQHAAQTCVRRAGLMLKKS